MDYEEFVTDYGTFGYYHILILTVIGLAANTTLSLNNFIINFLGTHAHHHCHVPGLENYTMSQQLKLSIPWDEHKQRYDSCHMYNDTSNVSVSQVIKVAEPCQHGWIYDTSVRDTTYIMEVYPGIALWQLYLRGIL